jgi:hypothetical protein
MYCRKKTSRLTKMGYWVWSYNTIFLNDSYVLNINNNYEEVVAIHEKLLADKKAYCC